MAFDPDQYLKSSSGSFDPDAYLGAPKPTKSLVDQIPGMSADRPVPAQPKARKMSDAEIAKDAALAIPDLALATASTVATGAIAPVVAGVTQFRKGAKGYEDEINRLSEAYTYTPKTVAGENIFNKTVVPAMTQILGPMGGMVNGGVSGRGRKAKPIGEPIKSGTKGEALKKEIEKSKTPVAASEPTQLELPLDNSPQQAAEMAARQQGQRDLFGPINEPLPKVIPETSFDPDVYLNSTQSDLFVDGGNMPDGQLDLFNQGQSVGRTDMVPETKPLPLETTAQGELFDQSTGGRVANPYEAATGDWRVDENGIPIKVDLSMEAQQMQEPLQRNIWGDELDPTMSPVGQGLQGVEDMSTQMGRPLTDAIDSMPWAQRRGAINRQLTGEVPASGELLGAMAEANSPFGGNLPESIRRQQGGAINIGAIGEALNDLKNNKILPLDYVKAFTGAFNQQEGHEMSWQHALEKIRDPNSRVRIVLMSPDQYHRLAMPRDADYNISKLAEEKRTSIREGLASPEGLTSMPLLTVDSGKVHGHEGRHRMDVFKEMGVDLVPVIVRDLGVRNEKGKLPYKFLISEGNGTTTSSRYHVAMDSLTEINLAGEKASNSSSFYVPQSQRGAIDLGNATEPKPDNKASKLSLTDPEVVAAVAAQDVNRRRNAAAKIVGLEGYDADINTPADVVAALGDGKVKDISAMQLAGGKSVTPGINTLAIKTNHPLLKYARTKLRSVVLETDALIRQHITGKDGFADTIGKLTQQEKNDLVEAWRIGDDSKTFLTPEQMRSAGYTDNVINALQKAYEIDKVKLDIWNKNRAKVGMPPVDSLPGHMPGIFKGDYKQLVFGKNKDGSRKIIGVIGVDHRWQLKGARNKILEQFPDASFTEVDRKALGGNGQKSDIFNGVNDLLQVLAKESPEFAKIQDLYRAGIKEQADALYGASLHSLAKKGVAGNEGNKPWLSADRNTNDFLKSYLNYWEEGIVSHKNLPVEAEVKGLMDNPALDDHSRAKEFVNDYMRNSTGRNLGTVGDALNKLIDAGPRALGLGSSTPRELVNQLNKRGGQQVMGFFNYMHTLLQFMQIPQMAIPEFLTVAKKIGVSAPEFLEAARDSIPMQIKLGIENTTTKKLLSDAERKITDEAGKRGLLNFSEFQEMSAVTQSKFSQKYDAFVDWNRTIAEKGTRPIVFFAAVKMLEKKGYKGDRLYDAAYNLTQAAMVDYHMNERPMMYKRLGVAGQLASSLQTFKHALLNQYGRQFGEARKGNWTPLAYSLVAANVLAGVTGVPFYDEADKMTQYITDEFFGGPKTIKELALKNLPEFAKIGALSSSTNINLQSRMSAADTLPNSIPEAISPYGRLASDIVGTGYDLATKQDPLAAKNFAVAMSPSGPIKGFVRDQVMVDSKGNQIDKYGMRADLRTERDRNLAKYGVGLSVDEAKRNENSYINRLRDTANRKAQADITEALKRKYVQGILTEEDVQAATDKYLARKGDPMQMKNSLISFAKTTPLTRQQRAQGIPGKTISSIYKYQNYQQEQ